jgi:hypothetical protein
MFEGLYSLLKNDGVRLDEKAVSKSQQKFMGMVHAAQKGETPASPKIAKVAKSMKKKDAKDFAKTKHKGLPNKIKKEDMIIADEDWKDYLKSKRSTSGRRELDNPWQHMKSTGRKFKQRTHKKESADESTLQMSLEAFNLEEQFDNIYADMLNEASVKKLSKSAKSSIKGAVTTPAANNNAGDAYKSWRFGLALAGAPEFPTKAVNEIGGDPLLTTYTDEEWDMIQYAAKQSDVGPIKRVSSNRSVEKEDTNKLSAVAKIKRNKYGV